MGQWELMLKALKKFETIGHGREKQG